MTGASSWPGRAATVLGAAVAAGVCVLLAGGTVAPAAASVRPDAAARIHWGRAEPVPGLAALNKGYNAAVKSVSCWAAGDCVAGGFYTDGHHHSQAFVAAERKGRWGSAIPVPGSAALNKGYNAAVKSVSCARTGVCVAVGSYTDKAGNTQSFTAGERNGRWGKAAQVPDPTLPGASINTVWCAAGGLCAAGGSFSGSTATEAWVMTEVDGRWHAAEEVPGIAALTVAGGSADVDALWCSSAGQCGAGGIYEVNGETVGYAAAESAFVVIENKGVWGNAEQVPAITALDPGMDAWVTLMSCPSAGHCTAAGYDYADPNTCSTPCETTFVVTEHDGGWETAQQSSLSDNDALTCLSAVDCVLAGDYWPTADTGLTAAGIASETNGHWGARADFSGAMSTTSVSCSSAGYCAAGGQTLAGSAFVTSEQRGTWGRAILPAGIPARYNLAFQTGAMVNAVACPPRSDLCVAGGFYEGPKGGLREFVVSQSG